MDQSNLKQVLQLTLGPGLFYIVQAVSEAANELSKHSEFEHSEQEWRARTSDPLLQFMVPPYVPGSGGNWQEH